jgi:polysaccharide export outer membrane protein
MYIRRISYVAMILAVVCAAAVCGADDKKPQEPASPAAASPIAINSQDYVIGDSDVLAINVWHEPDLTRVVPVRSDGKISLPLLGDVLARGLSPAQLQAKLTQQLKSLLENPEVTVIVQESHSKHFSIVGLVVKPGSYDLSQRITVLDAIALAGGFRDFAKIKKIYVLRVGPDGKEQRLPFNYKRVVDGDMAQNFPLEPLDTIVVP